MVKSKRIELDEVRELLEDENIRKVMCITTTKAQAATLLAAVTAARGRSTTLSSITAVLEELTEVIKNKRLDEDLLPVFDTAEGTAHTCCVHCYTEENTVFKGCGC